VTHIGHAAMSAGLVGVVPARDGERRARADLTTADSRSNEDGLPSAAIRFAVDQGGQPRRRPRAGGQPAGMLRGIGRAQQGERVREPGRAWAGDGAGELPTTPEGFRRWTTPSTCRPTRAALEAGTVAFFGRAGVEQISALP
jgi:hypothetical protein